MLTDLKLDDIVQLRKTHPCGSTQWRVYRLGADIGIVCLTCDRRIMLERRKLAHRIKQILPPESLTNPD